MSKFQSECYVKRDCQWSEIIPNMTDRIGLCVWGMRSLQNRGIHCSLQISFLYLGKIMDYFLHGFFNSELAFQTSSHLRLESPNYPAI